MEGKEERIEVAMKALNNERNNASVMCEFVLCWAFLSDRVVRRKKFPFESTVQTQSKGSVLSVLL